MRRRAATGRRRWGAISGNSAEKPTISSVGVVAKSRFSLCFECGHETDEIYRKLRRGWYPVAEVDTVFGRHARREGVNWVGPDILGVSTSVVVLVLQ